MCALFCCFGSRVHLALACRWGKGKIYETQTQEDDGPDTRATCTVLNFMYSRATLVEDSVALYSLSCSLKDKA